MNTPCHLAMQRALGFRTPTYAHISVTVSESGGKLSKRERAKSLLDALKKLPNPNFDELAEAGGVTRTDPIQSATAAAASATRSAAS